MAKVELTVIVPVYNEEESLWKFKEEMDIFLEKSPVTAQILFVNDGSIDNSLQIIKKIVDSQSHYTYIALARNNGLSTALKAGFDFADTKYIGYMDADLQTSPLDFILYFSHLENYAMVNGIRVDRHDSAIKKISSIVANRFRRLVINDGIRDTCCPLKIIHSSYAKRIPFFNGMHRFLPALVQLQGGKVKQLEVRHFERYAGTAKYNLLNRLIGPFIDTLAFAWMRSHTIKYEILESGMFAESEHLEATLISNDE